MRGKKKDPPKSYTSKMKMTLRKKKSSKLYPFNINVYLKHRNTSCTLLKLVYIIQLWKICILKQHDYL